MIPGIVGQGSSVGGGGGGGGTDPDFASVVALLHMDGANGSTTFTDVTGRTWTGAGTLVEIDTAQSVFGGASAEFTGTSGRIATASSADFAYGTGDFTIEFRYRPTSVTGGRILWEQRASSGQGGRPVIYTSGTSLIYFLNNANRITATSAVAINTWYAIALCREGSSTRLFLDGTQVGSTFTDSTNMGSGDPVYIGNTFGFNAGALGWIDELRVTKGVARYTGAYTPDTAPFPDS